MCVIIIATLFLANDINNAVSVLRQISLMVSICGALMEFTLVTVKAALLLDPLLLFSKRERIIFMFFPLRVVL